MHVGNIDYTDNASLDHLNDPECAKFNIGGYRAVSKLGHFDFLDLPKRLVFLHKMHYVSTHQIQDHFHTHIS